MVLGFEVLKLGFEVLGLGFEVLGLSFDVLGLGSEIVGWNSASGLCRFSLQKYSWCRIAPKTLQMHILSRVEKGFGKASKKRFFDPPKPSSKMQKSEAQGKPGFGFEVWG